MRARKMSILLSTVSEQQVRLRDAEKGLLILFSKSSFEELGRARAHNNPDNGTNHKTGCDSMNLLVYADRRRPSPWVLSRVDATLVVQY